ncbi:DUF1697 domain-containing protein [uncultured Erythrobacter sp.]|uniref:DUF1697 domain-containing protein n=1 Tax=uncultured Erythrobacter sp. TaxID=263913 RepID=UPI00262AFAF8|nr:DUF1697 domain-containing protein [uncultured Erythrobacter sp.]
MSTRYLALLGSINIGGNRVKMVDLKAALAQEGLQELETVAASGNVILTDPREPFLIEMQLEQILAERFGFKSCAMVRSQAEVREAVDDNPFYGVGSDKMVHSIFLSDQPQPGRFEDLFEERKAKGDERLALGDRVLFLDYVHGVSASDITGKLLERRLGVKGTARNMNSLKNILNKMGG